MRLVSHLLIRLTARKVGVDEFGNSYYQARRPNRLGRLKRFVIYGGEAEASKVPAEWHGWLHHTETDPPPEEGYARRPWQKAHLPNLTGTIHAYYPEGHLTKGRRRKPATGDYEAWRPE